MTNFMPSQQGNLGADHSAQPVPEPWVGPRVAMGRDIVMRRNEWKNCRVSDAIMLRHLRLSVRNWGISDPK